MDKVVQKRWFHATTKENYKKIIEEGVLWGSEYYGKRETFLARNLEELIRMINLPLIQDLKKCELVLSVKYTPNNIDDDYNPKKWEMIVKKPIDIENVRFLKYL